MATNFKALERTITTALGGIASLSLEWPKPSIFVINRRGDRIQVHFDIITQRNEELRSHSRYGYVLNAIDSAAITAEVVRRFRNGMTTRELDAETAAICIDHTSHSIDYDWLAARICISDLHKRTPASMDIMVKTLIRSASDAASIRYSTEFIGIVERASAMIADKLDLDRDYRLNFFGFQTISRSYLLRSSPRSEKSSLADDQIMERPQHLYMRIALGIFVCQPDGRGHMSNDTEFDARLAMAFQYYNALSLQLVSNATPTLLNAGTIVPQLSSCFQLATGDDLPTLFDTVKSAALISKWSGGISLWLHNIRATGAPIRKTGGRSTGIKHYVKILNDIQIYVNQGGNRPGAFAIYLSVDHDDIFTFLAMARLKGEDALRSLNAPDLKYALWVSDLFMETLIAELAGGNGDWYLFDPSTAPGMHLVYGKEYKQLYSQYVAEGRARRVVKASAIIAEAFKTWVQVGTPYVLFKDSINHKSNMCNVGPICSSNLCTEILIPSWSTFDAPDFAKFNSGNAAGGEFGVCNLAAICLGNFVNEEGIDFESIIDAASLETRALNHIIDITHYPSEECRRSNQRHRPIGVGIMGLANVLAKLNIIYGSPEATEVARAIAAAVYYGAMRESCALAKRDGPYTSFAGSPISKGILQPDLWHVTDHLAAGWELEIAASTKDVITSETWNNLRAEVQRYGVRNAYVTAYMPTATTSNIVGQNECFEPFTSNIYTRKTLAGEFLIINHNLIQCLNDLNLWDDTMRREILVAGGSIQNISNIPMNIRRIYKTAREIHPSLIIRMATAMAPFICQSMSMNLYLDEPELPKIIRFLVEGWRAGLKTGMYYCHMKPAAGSQKTSTVVTTAPEECASCVL